MSKLRVEIPFGAKERLLAGESLTFRVPVGVDLTSVEVVLLKDTSSVSPVGDLFDKLISEIGNLTKKKRSI